MPLSCQGVVLVNKFKLNIKKMKMQNFDFNVIGNALSRAEMKKVTGGLVQCQSNPSCSPSGSQSCGSGCACMCGWSGGTINSYGCICSPAN